MKPPTDVDVAVEVTTMISIVVLSLIVFFTLLHIAVIYKRRRSFKRRWFLSCSTGMIGSTRFFETPIEFDCFGCFGPFGTEAEAKEARKLLAKIRPDVPPKTEKSP